MKSKSTIILILFALLLPLQSHGLDVEVDIAPLLHAYPSVREIEVRYTVVWNEKESRHVLLPPELPDVEWGSLRLISMAVRKKGERLDATILLGVTAAQPGRFTLPPLEFRLVALSEEEGWDDELSVLPLASSHLVSSEAVEIRISDSSAFVVPTILSAVVVVLAAVLFYLRRQRKKAAMATPVMSLDEELTFLLHQARRHRLDGNYYEAYRSLYGLALKCQEHNGDVPPPLLSRLDDKIKDIGYRGKGPSESDLEGDFKDIEQLCAQLRTRGTQGVR